MARYFLGGFFKLVYIASTYRCQPAGRFGRRNPVRRSAGLAPTRLLTGVRFDLQGLIVLPGDVEPAGHPHNVWRTIAAALFPNRLIFGGIPLVRDLSALGIEGNAREIALRRSDHTEPPVLGHYRDPITGEVVIGGILGRAPRWRSPPASPSLSGGTLDDAGSRLTARAKCVPDRRGNDMRVVRQLNYSNCFDCRYPCRR
jgi:hypothetical protein